MDYDWSKIVPLTVGHVSFHWACIALHSVHHTFLTRLNYRTTMWKRAEDRQMSEHNCLKSIRFVKILFFIMHKISSSTSG